MGWRWWLSLNNPRTLYMVCGAFLALVLVLGVTAVAALLTGHPWSGGILAFLAVANLRTTINIIKMERKIEELRRAHHDAFQAANFEMMVQEAWTRVANAVNDDMEKAGHGRPVRISVENSTVH